MYVRSNALSKSDKIYERIFYEILGTGEHKVMKATSGPINRKMEMIMLKWVVIRRTIQAFRYSDTFA